MALQVGENRVIKNKYIKYVLSVVVLGSFIGGFIAYQHTYANGFKNYTEHRDKQFLHKIFDENIYWLYAGDPSEFSLDQLLETGKLTHGQGTYDITMKVYVVENKPVGFVAYYMKTLTKGILLFLVVDKEQRGHGYGEKLLKYGCDQLFNKGALVVQLLTRTDNTAALSLYKRHGFKEFWVEDGFVQLELKK